MGVHKYMKLTWTEVKRTKTLQERGLDFARAGEIFADLHVTRATHGGKSAETRFVTAGFIDGRLVVMVWTSRGDTRHIISMRHAHAKEQNLWKEEMDRSR